MPVDRHVKVELVLEGVSPHPLLRGNPVLMEDLTHIKGSIPAPAGEPARDKAGVAEQGVYPRACGTGMAVS